MHNAWFILLIWVSVFFVLAVWVFWDVDFKQMFSEELNEVPEVSGETNESNIVWAAAFQDY